MRAWIGGEEQQAPSLKTRRLYRLFRHPMYVGLLTAVWATPRMTVGHALLAAGMTLYVDRRAIRGARPRYPLRTRLRRLACLVISFLIPAGVVP